MGEHTVEAKPNDLGWNDEPIRVSSQDKLRRLPSAERTAKLITRNHRLTSSVVHGFEVPWGSGKYSVIALMRNALEQESQTTWRTADFSPRADLNRGQKKAA